VARVTYSGSDSAPAQNFQIGIRDQ